MKDKEVTREQLIKELGEQKYMSIFNQKHYEFFKDLIDNEKLQLDIDQIGQLVKAFEQDNPEFDSKILTKVKATLRQKPKHLRVVKKISKKREKYLNNWVKNHIS